MIAPARSVVCGFFSSRLLFTRGSGSCCLDFCPLRPLSPRFVRPSIHVPASVRKRCVRWSADVLRCESRLLPGSSGLLLSAVPKPDAGGLPDQSRAVQPTQADNARRICCLKNAYCCQIRRPCCRPAASEETNASAAAETPAVDSTVVVAKPTCCAKRAYCCEQKKPCCR